MRTLEEESYVAFSDIRGLFGDDGEMLHPSKIPEDIRRAVASSKIRTRALPGGGTERTVEIRLWDKGKALERISRHLGLFEKDNAQKAALASLLDALDRRDPEAADRLRRALRERIAAAK